MSYSENKKYHNYNNSISESELNKLYNDFETSLIDQDEFDKQKQAILNGESSVEHIVSIELQKEKRLSDKNIGKAAFNDKTRKEYDRLYGKKNTPEDRSNQYG